MDEDFDLEGFANASAIPTITPSLTTFYYPDTPENTRAAGLDPSMEGGPTGGGKFSDIDLRNHTLEKFLSGESPFVAVAMKGEPSGAEFNLNVNGSNVLAKNVDTGGGLRDGQVDVATNNPDLAKHGIQHAPFDIGGFANGKVGEPPQGVMPRSAEGFPSQATEPLAVMEGAPPEPSAAKEEKQREPISMPSFEPTPIPQVSVNIPTVPMMSNREIIGSPMRPVVAQGIPIPTRLPSPPTVAPSFLDKPIVSPQQVLPVAQAFLRTNPAIALNLEALRRINPEAANSVDQFTAEQLSNLSAPTTAAETVASFAAPEIYAGIQGVRGAQNVGSSINQYGLASRQTAAAATGATLNTALAALPLAAKGSTLKNLIGAGKFAKSYRVDKELGDLVNTIAASPESAAYRAWTSHFNVTDGLNKEQQSLLGKYLVSRRLRGVNPNHPQILPDAEMTRIESDPEISKAISRYVSEVKPDIEALRKQAGLTEGAAAGKEKEFISLLPKTDEMLPQSPAVGPLSLNRLAQKTTHRLKAEGFAKEYSTDLKEILEHSYRDALTKANRARFLEAARAKGYIDYKPHVIGLDADGQPIWNNRLDPEDLPAQLKHDFRAATETKLQPEGLAKAWRQFQKLSTSASLSANPVAALNHMRRALGIVASKSAAGVPWYQRLETIIPYIGPRTGTFIRTVTDDMSSPENQAILKDLFAANAGSTRGFYDRYGFQKKIPIISWLQRQTHKLLFGIPRGMGVNGFDLRLRVQLEKMRRAAEGNVDPQRMREFANQIGQYGSHPDWIIEQLRNLDPFAATSLPMRVAEMKNLVGMSGLKDKNAAMKLFRFAETQMRGTGGLIVGLAAANYVLSGKWPWENAKGHQLDLNMGSKDDKGGDKYIRLRVLAPEFSRALGTLGIPDILREQQADNPQNLAALGTALANQGLSIVTGPGEHLIQAVTTGTAPYLVRNPGSTKAPGFMDIAKTKQGESRAVNQAYAALGTLNPLLGPVAGRDYEPFGKITVSARPDAQPSATPSTKPSRMKPVKMVKSKMIRRKIQ